MIGQLLKKNKVHTDIASVRAKSKDLYNLLRIFVLKMKVSHKLKPFRNSGLRSTRQLESRSITWPTRYARTELKVWNRLHYLVRAASGYRSYR